MEKKETRLKKAFFRLFDSIWGTRAWKEKIQQVTIGGTPDILGCVPCKVCGRGLFFGCELKNPGERLAELQASKGRRIKNAGGLFLAYRSSADMAVIEEYAEMIPVLDILVLQELARRWVSEAEISSPVSDD